MTQGVPGAPNHAMGAPVQRRDRTLTPYEVAFVAKARSQGRPVSWTNISIQLNRSEHDIRVCCDPTYQDARPLPVAESAKPVRSYKSSAARIRALLETGPATHAQIARVVPPEFSIARTMCELIHRGVVKRVDGGQGRGTKATYALVEAEA